ERHRWDDDFVAGANAQCTKSKRQRIRAARASRRGGELVSGRECCLELGACSRADECARVERPPEGSLKFRPDGLVQPADIEERDHRSTCTDWPDLAIDSSIALSTRTTSTPWRTPLGGGSPVRQLVPKVSISVRSGSLIVMFGMRMSPARVRHWNSPMPAYSPSVGTSARATPASNNHSF